jgi:uncharacterized protein (DUF1684 family)
MKRIKYLSLLLFVGFNAAAQSYVQQIEKHIEQYKQDFIESLGSPLKEKDLKNLHFFEANPSYRAVAEITLLKDETAIKIPTSGGQAKKFFRYAKATFTINGKQLQLTLFKSEVPSPVPAYRDLLFLPFTDETNSVSTYGGGRYIDINLNEIKNGQLVLDFNKAYNPYCAYSHGYQCPVPPQENDLAIAIMAGEKLYTGKIK